MDSLADWMNENLGKIIIIFDLQNRRYEGKLERVFVDFFQIFETRQKLSKVFRFSQIKDFSLAEGKPNGS